MLPRRVLSVAAKAAPRAGAGQFEFDRKVRARLVDRFGEGGQEPRPIIANVDRAGGGAGSCSYR